MDTSPDDHPERTALGLGNECDIPDLEVTGIRRRTDGLYVISSRGQVAMTLSERQMTIVRAAANAQYGHLMKRELHALAYPDQPRMQLRTVRMSPEGFARTWPIPLTPSQRASLSRTLSRLADYNLIDRLDGHTVRPTNSGRAIAKWVNAHPNVLERG